MFSRTRPGEGCQELTPPVYQKKPGRPDLDVYRNLFEPLSSRLGPLGSSRVCPSATKTFKAALRSYGHLGRDRQRNGGLFSGIIRDVSNPREGSNILTFLFRSRLVCRARSYIPEARGR
jgi:hypothetical protein